MKKTILSTLFLLFCIGNIHAEETGDGDVQPQHGVEQKHYPEGTSWTEVTTNLIDETYCKVDEYVVKGDTVIDSHSYKKLKLNGKSHLALREKDNQVFLYSLERKEERLAYDFAWEIGKTIYYQPFEADEYFSMAEIEKINQILLSDGQTYDCIGECIRSIGYRTGIFQHMFVQPPNGDQIRLLCFSRNNALIYKNDDYPHCNSCKREDTKIAEFPEANPVLFIKDMFYFSFEAQTEKHLVIYDVMGNKIISQNITHASSFQTDGLKSGIYFCQIISEQGDNLYTEKIICF